MGTVTALRQPSDDLQHIIDEYLCRYSNPRTEQWVRLRLTDMVRTTGVRHLDGYNEKILHAYITAAKANNSVRGRLTVCRTFFKWCLRKGLIAEDPTTELDRLTKQYPKIYGRVQAPTPARWLTQEEAFTQLVGACQDGTQKGLRDEIVIRLGLSGIRCAEIRNLTIGDIDFAVPCISWMGKGRRARKIVPGDKLIVALRQYLQLWADATGSPPTPEDILVCAGKVGGSNQHLRDGAIVFGLPVRTNQPIVKAVRDRAKLAGLGHVATHDLRRSAAGILHHATTDDGAHRYDLLDIQKVLGHADPATTMRSYLDPMDTGVIGRAAADLD